MASLLLPYTTSQYIMDIARKYIKIIIGACYIMLGVFLYQIRQLKVERAMGTLLNQEFRVIIKRVNSFHANKIAFAGRNSKVTSFYKNSQSR
jgi:hypothetical protein